MKPKKSTAISSRPTLFVAIPAMNEMEYLPATIKAIEQQQTRYEYQVYICVNQPDAWWEDEAKKDVCRNNQETLHWLRTLQSPRIHLIDHSSQGRGWDNKNYGVGYARKVLFDTIRQQANPNDLIISLDADTVFDEKYFQSVGDTMHRYPNWVALSLPYYHPLTGREDVDRAILRYELYLRNYFINLSLISSPYTFTAIGSAIILRVSALNKIGGITPVKSGEDFYLLQKLRKMGIVGNWNPVIVQPASRFSSRVFFGTGPAMIKGNAGDWSSYPIYHCSLFQEIEDSYKLIETLFTQNIKTPFLQFLEQQFKDSDLWGPLRKNYNTLPQFTKAFHQKADGLRLLQYLKQEQSRRQLHDIDSLKANWSFFQLPLPDFLSRAQTLEDFSTKELSILRDTLYDLETHLRQKEAQ